MINLLNKKKKKKNLNVKGKSPVEKVSKSSHLDNVWNKDDFINEKFNNRPLEFYIRSYRLNINISFIFSLLALVVVISSGIIIEQKKAAHDYYVSSTDGRIVEHELTRDDVNKMREAFRVISNNRNR